ncbi:hypothetical protein OEZ86_007086 [Tetradesmus obliquus]|nr:hypothetical protein OEZ86_007086 [Tetradesmus obliquus]
MDSSPFALPHKVTIQLLSPTYEDQLLRQLLHQRCDQRGVRMNIVNDTFKLMLPRQRNPIKAPVKTIILNGDGKQLLRLMVELAHAAPLASIDIAASKEARSIKFAEQPLQLNHHLSFWPGEWKDLEIAGGMAAGGDN